MNLLKVFSRFAFRKRKPEPLAKESAFEKRICELVGYKVNRIGFFREAFTLKTSSKNTEHHNYERLEFLGDAVLGSIVSCYLYDAYPDANEGFLTQMKSKAVNRKNLNAIGESLRLRQLLLNNDGSITLSENISGNLVEALIGAIYLDIGYERCNDVVLKQILTKDAMLRLENKIISYKGLLLELAQKNKLHVRFDTQEEQLPKQQTQFRCVVYLGDDSIGVAGASSKKKAEEKAANRAYYAVQKRKDIHNAKGQDISP
ncbi:MAG: ribonuclease III [Chryseobacterium sp.]|nr:MAG: ribonuclease III [Chryseobacterium sp.]